MKDMLVNVAQAVFRALRAFHLIPDDVVTQDPPVVLQRDSHPPRDAREVLIHILIA